MESRGGLAGVGPRWGRPHPLQDFKAPECEICRGCGRGPWRGGASQPFIWLFVGCLNDLRTGPPSSFPPGQGGEGL